VNTDNRIGKPLLEVLYYDETSNLTFVYKHGDTVHVATIEEIDDIYRVMHAILPLHSVTWENIGEWVTWQEQDVSTLDEAKEYLKLPDSIPDAVECALEAYYRGAARADAEG